MGRAIVVLAVLTVAVTAIPADAAKPVHRTYPWHHRIIATTFWVGEIFDPNAEDGSQVISTYDGNWLRNYGGCDGKSSGGDCTTEKRLASNGFFPRTMTPKQNPFYIDLPFDDVNNSAAFTRRGTVIPWAKDAKYRKNITNNNVSLMKNRWVQIKNGKHTCYGQIEDAGPGQYNDAKYVFGKADQRPKNTRYGGAGMDVSPALNSCLHFRELDGDSDSVAWRFVEASAVPPGPWRKVITRTGVQN